MLSLLAGFVTLACAAASTQAALYTDPAQLPKGKRYDYVVIGSGPGGSTVAARLSEDPHVNVLVIEAGVKGDGVLDIDVPALAPNLQPSSAFDWNYTVVPQAGLDNRTFPFSRGKVLGGTSKLNWMFWSRGPRADYDKYAQLTGDPGWSWDSLLPLWKKVERLVAPADHHDTTGEIDPTIHGTKGAISISVHGAPFPTDPHVVDAAKELGGVFELIEDYNSGNPLGVARVQCSYGGGIRSNAGTSYIEPTLSRRNLDVLIQTQVTKLLKTGSEGNTPVFRGVQFAQSSSAPKYVLNVTREVILSAGAFNTPQLLMLSGLGPSDQLKGLGIPTIVDLPDVGQHLADHPSVALPYGAASVQDDIFTNLARNATFFNDTISEWEAKRQGIATNSVSNNIGFFRIAANDSVFKTQPDPSSGPTAPHLEFLAIPGLFPFLEFVPPNTEVTSFAAILVSPTSRGSVTLSSSDPFAAPVINPNLLGTAFDIAAIRHAVRSVQDFAAAPAWSGFLIGPTLGLEDVHSDAEVDAYARNVTTTIWHPTGTAFMAKCGPAGKESGVVNPDLTVKGVKGLRVVDASVFPFIPAAHPQAVIYVFAERAAELIKSGKSACS
ncbi:alcohol oxidase [Trametes meyenii]|nr:alcohol oxidase [Trametes meyenii]